MKKGKGFRKCGLSLLLVMTLITSALIAAIPMRVSAGGDVVSGNGRLKVVGTQLCNEAGQPIQLKGVSSAGLQYYGEYMNINSIKWLRDDWGITVIRAAMYTAEKGYITNTSYKEKVKEIVNAATELGIYVIIDWHILSDGDPNMYKTQAKEFFAEMSSLYKDHKNVIYEICNEPNKVQWSSSIKPYANEVIPVIRANDPESVILVGTGTWSQDVDQAANDPLNFKNIQYVCHFYAGTHGQYLRDKINTALSKGCGVFVSEWGTSLASGTGGVFVNETKTWIDFLNSKKISWVNWSLCTKAETSAILNAGASTQGGWNSNNLTQSGNLVKSLMGGGIPSTIPSNTPTPTNTPTKIPTITPTVTPTRVPTNTPPPSSNAVVEDINGDKAVNMADAILIAGCFNATTTSNKYNTKCDLNNDGVINMTDVIMLAVKFNYTYR
ncbi:cellulase family glycosylhydrolase [Pseudobacteroides cellulosolvens]|uniref:cellulase n=1 Tax=Pseudobacteroides cellulosolvens ATCC 35603 = DSM 2933 TaxID=398512 RepID=A0A0L6JWL1_9FIRM|nr:cellulase family glycosylhydrolase [Pseudobacteroides cellulosolvens]KNY30231.1 Cellulase [Pseudobacteroides cellulosolvens ATCC 35603 = DSM 2933]